MRVPAEPLRDRPAVAPLYPLEGVVSWNMNTTCNYRCSYCTQRFVDDRGRWAKDLPDFVRAFVALPGDWEIKLSGGEPFRHPGFIDAVRELAEGGLRVSVVTNLSSSDDELRAFADATNHRPGMVSASLHLEYQDPKAFAAKLNRLARVYQGSVCVTCVATRDNLPKLAAMRSQFEASGLVFKVQPEKQDREVIEYSDDERRSLLALGGHNLTGDIAPNFAGRPCWAGARYFIVDHKGDAYRCYPARRYRKEHLGNLLQGPLQIASQAAPCRYQYCNCTVPQQRGMVDVRKKCSLET